MSMSVAEQLDRQLQRWEDEEYLEVLAEIGMKVEELHELIDRGQALEKHGEQLFVIAEELLGDITSRLTQLEQRVPR